MASSNPSTNPPSRVSSPNSAANNSRFTSASTAEDLLKSQTVGLVHLSDFRKRRAEALEQKEREATNFGRFTSGSTSRGGTPNDGVSTPGKPSKKKRKLAAKGKLSFGIDDEDAPSTIASRAESPKSDTSERQSSRVASPAPPRPNDGIEKKRLGPNNQVSVTPKAMTKSALLREASTREQLRKEFLEMQEAVKATEVIIPFVFYDGTNIPGGICKVKKGDFVWVLLDRSRKVGAELGVGGGEKASSRREWARVGVDDLMLVRGEVIIPHHYEIYYFIVNKTLGPSSTPLFSYSSTVLPASKSPSSSRSPSPGSDPLTLPTKRGNIKNPDSHLEGIDDDPHFTKVVDRRWYERNKHIFPASVWEEFDPAKDYSKGKRQDAEGNAFFFT